MKSYISFIISLFIVLCFLTSTVLAEGSTFELREGIHFGASKGEIMMKETLKESNEFTSRLLPGHYEYTGKILNNPDSYVFYGLDDDGHLNEMVYRLAYSSSDKAMACIDYLGEQYGVPYAKGDSFSCPLLGNVSSFHKDSDILYCREWLIPDGDNYVKVDMYFMVAFSAIVWIDYTVFPADVVTSQVTW